MLNRDLASLLLSDLESHTVTTDLSFPNGMLGRFFYLGLRLPRITKSDGFKKGLERIVDHSFHSFATPALFGGKGGALFVAHHLAPNLARKLDPLYDANCRDFFNCRENHFELISGVTGVGLLAEVRNNLKLSRWATRKLLSEIRKTEMGPAWLNREDYVRLFEVKPPLPRKFQLNLGLAHGILGPLLFLLRQTSGPDSDLAYRGVKMVLPTLRKLSHTFSETPVGCARPPLEEENTYPPSAWCYGDPGLGLTLVQAGRHLLDFELFEAGIHIAKRGLTKIKIHPREELHLCHGTAGHALLADRLWRMTKDPEFHHLKHRWIHRTEELMATKSEAELMSRSDPRFGGFLYGAIGADLVMHETTRLRKSRWDAFMMTDE